MFELLKPLLDDHQVGMSDFQDDYFVTVRSGGNVYGQYKQALRELYKRFRDLRELFFGENGRKYLELDIRDLTDHEEDDERKLIELQHKTLLMEECDRAITECYREFVRFYQQASLLKEKIGDLSPEKRRELETEMWVWRVKELAAMNLLSFGRIKTDTLQLARSMPKDPRKEIFDCILDPNQHKKLIDDYINYDGYVIDFEDLKIESLKIEDIERLIEYK